MAMQPVLPLGMLAVVSLVATSSAMAQQPVRPLPKVGGCPVGYFASADYCVPSKSGNSRGAIEKYLRDRGRGGSFGGIFVTSIGASAELAGVACSPVAPCTGACC